MKNIAFVIAMLFVALSAFAQSTIQRGVTYRYNGKNRRTPIGGVYLKPATADNGVVSDEADGTFALSLKNCKMGDRIGSVKVTKQGMMVFNQQTVDEWSVRKEPLHLILCDANEFQQQKRNLIAIGEREAKKKYEKKLAQLRERNDANQLKLDDYYTKLDSLEKEYQNALKHMDEYADVFARIDESEIDTLAQHAVELFNKGEIEESIRLLEEGNYEKRLDDALRTKSQAQELRHLADSAEALADNDIDRCMNAIRTQVSAYKLNNDFQKAGTLLKTMADKLQTLGATWNYAMFCYDQYQFAEAETYFLKFEDILKRIPSENNDAQYVRLYNRLGTLYQRMTRYQKSMELLLKGLKILELNNSDDYESYVRIYINLSLTYISLKRFSESEEMVKKAFESCGHLPNDNIDVKNLMAGAYNNLGLLYYNTNRYDESEKMYMSAFDIFERLAKDNTNEHMSSMAMVCYNLARIYNETKRYGESEEMYNRALAIYGRLAKYNPEAYDSRLASTIVNYGDLCLNTKRYGESEEMYNRALAIYGRLAKYNPEVYDSRLAWVYTCLGNLYVDTKDFSKAEKLYKITITIYERLSAKNPKVYKRFVAQSYYNLGLLYFKIEHFGDCEEMYTKTLTIFERLSEKNPESFERDLGTLYFSLGLLFLQTKRSNDSEKALKKGMSIIERLHNKNPEAYEAWLESYYFYLGRACYENEDYSLSFCYCEKLLQRLGDKYRQEAETNKEAYFNQLRIQSMLANKLGKFNEGETYSLEALQVDSANHVAYCNLAAALLFQGRVVEAEKLYRQYKKELKDIFLNDFAEYERLKVIPIERTADVERIKAMLKAE